MISQSIESMLQGVEASDLTDVVVMLLVVSFVVAVVLKRKNQSHAFTQYAPTLLTTLGILGTFAGIVVGLLAFDEKDIDGSIELLLAGLKTAFITSLIGMLLSVVYKILVSCGWLTSQVNEDEIDEDQIGIAELYGAMKDQVGGIEQLKAAIGGDGENSLVSQVKLLRSDAGDYHKKTIGLLDPAVMHLQSISSAVKQQETAFVEFQDRLWLKLQDFADMLSKSATEQVINALKEVIADFNNNLTEQFGENFKQLNAAVLELVKWQDNYKLQLAQMMEQYAQGVQAITQTEASVSHISEESKVIPSSMQELKTVMEVNHHQLQELERHLDAFKDIRDRAVEALPEIRTQIDTTVEGMKTASATMTEGLTNATNLVVSGIEDSGKALMHGVTETADGLVENSKRVNESLQGTSDLVMSNNEKSKELFDDFISESNSHIRNMVAEMQEGSRQIQSNFNEASSSLIREIDVMRTGFESGLSDMRGRLGDSMQQLADQQMRENQRILQGMSQQAEKALTDTGESLTKQVNALNDATSQQLNAVMKQFGAALTTITGKFTDDYSKLVDAMGRVTRSQTGR